MLHAPQQANKVSDSIMSGQLCSWREQVMHLLGREGGTVGYNTCTLIQVYEMSVATNWNKLWFKTDWKNKYKDEILLWPQFLYVYNKPSENQAKKKTGRWGQLINQLAQLLRDMQAHKYLA